MGSLLNQSHSPKKMEQEKKKSKLLSFIDKYRLVREDDLVFYIRTSMEEVQSTSQKLELSGRSEYYLENCH